MNPWRVFIFDVVLSLMTAMLLWGEALIKVPTAVDDRDSANHVTMADGFVWLAMDSGAYRVEQDNSVTSVLSNKKISTIAKVFNEIWLGTEDGIYVVGNPERLTFGNEIGNEIKDVTAITQIGNSVLIGATSNGLFRLACGRNVSSPADCLPSRVLHRWIFTIEIIGNSIWIGTADGSYRMESVDADPHRISLDEDQENKIAKIRKIDKYIWLLSDGSDKSFQIFKEQITPHDRPRLLSAAEFQGAVWMGGLGLLFHWNPEDGSLREVNLVNRIELGSVNEIIEFNEKLWLATSEGLYRGSIHDLSFEIDRQYPGNEFYGISQIENDIWSWGKEGVCRFRSDVSFQVRFNTHGIGRENLRLLLGNDLRIRGVRYHQDGNDFYGDNPMRETFKVAVATDKIKLREHIQRSPLELPSGEYSEKFSIGFYDLYVAVRNECNTIDIVGPYEIFVTGSWWRELIVLPVLFGVVLLFTIVFPQYAWPLSVNFNLPRWGGIIHTFPYLRRQIVLHHAKKLQDSLISWAGIENCSKFLLFLSEDTAASEGEGRMISLEDMLAMLRGQRRVILLDGKDFDTRSFMVNLFREIAGGRKLRGQRVPVLFRLDPDASSALGLVDIQDLLSRYTGYEHRDAISSFLRAGGYLFLFHGYGRLPEAARIAVRQFMSRYDAKSCYFIISLDDDSRDLDDMINTKIRVEPTQENCCINGTPVVAFSSPVHRFSYRNLGRFIPEVRHIAKGVIDLFLQRLTKLWRSSGE